MFALWTNVPLLLYATSGGIVLIPLVATAIVFRNRQLWSLAFGLAIAAGALNAAIELAQQSDASNNILNRDIGAIALLAFACPMVSAAFTVALRRRNALVRVAAATAVVVVFAFAAPLLLVAAHCTSGDCL